MCSITFRIAVQTILRYILVHKWSILANPSLWQQERFVIQEMCFGFLNCVKISPKLERFVTRVQDFFPFARNNLMFRFLNWRLRLWDVKEWLKQCMWERSTLCGSAWPPRLSLLCLRAHGSSSHVITCTWLQSEPFVEVWEQHSVPVPIGKQVLLGTWSAHGCWLSRTLHSFAEFLYPYPVFMQRPARISWRCCPEPGEGRKAPCPPQSPPAALPLSPAHLNRWETKVSRASGAGFHHSPLSHNFFWIPRLPWGKGSMLILRLIPKEPLISQQRN